MNDSVPVVEECPPPPYYYTEFDDNWSSTIKPPPIPSSSVIQDKLPFRQLSTTSLAKFDQVDDINSFKDSLMRHLNKIKSLSLHLSSDIPSSMPVNQVAMQLNNNISEIYTLLKSYRDHEAREDLCEEMRAQLESAKAIEVELMQYIDRTQNELKLTS